MKKALIFAAILVSNFYACVHSAKPTKNPCEKYQIIHKTDWLIGNWQRVSKEGTLTEAWTQLNDSTFAGRSFFISNGDTLSSELISLEQRNGKLYYIPTLADQNDGKAVVFTITSLTDSSATFENPEHDFPQKIDYRFQKPDSLIAEVSAVMNGNQKTINFRMGRVK